MNEQEVKVLIANVKAFAQKLAEKISAGVSITKEDKNKLNWYIQKLEQATAEISGKVLWSNDVLGKTARQNERLNQAITDAKTQIEAMRAEVDKLTAPPLTFGIFSKVYKDGRADVYTVGGRKLRVNVHPAIDVKLLRCGQEVKLNEAMNIVEIAENVIVGEQVRIKQVLEGVRVIISFRADEERVAELGEDLYGVKLRAGDRMLYDNSSGYLVEKLPKFDTETFLLEEIPDVTFQDIGGLKKEIEAVQDEIELPFLYTDEFKAHKLRAIKGILLYGPPGCGKTMIAKAIANSIEKKLAHITKKERRAYLLHVNGPELLNKFVGETERQMREIFDAAKEKADEGHPVIIFFDEMDALFRIRGSGISSDIESTTVPQFLSLIDGVERLQNVIVIGASNRQDLIDPAILRPGRLDRKIKISRPGAVEAFSVFEKYLIRDLPWHERLRSRVKEKTYRQRNRLKEADHERWQELPEEFRKMRQTQIVSEEKTASGELWETWKFENEDDMIHYIIFKMVEAIYFRNKDELVWTASDGKKIHIDNCFIEITYASGTKEILYFGDMMSGAIIESIVARMKKYSIKREIKKEPHGLSVADGYRAIREEFSESGDIVNNIVNPDEWSKISGKKGEKIVSVRRFTNNALVFMTGGTPEKDTAQKQATTGHYL